MNQSEKNVEYRIDVYWAVKRNREMGYDVGSRVFDQVGEALTRQQLGELLSGKVFVAGVISGE